MWAPPKPIENMSLAEVAALAALLSAPPEPPGLGQTFRRRPPITCGPTRAERRDARRRQKLARRRNRSR